MIAGTERDFAWHDPRPDAVRVEHPLLRQPLTLIVDDPTPGYNPAYFHSGFLNGPPMASPDLVDRFADFIDRHDVRGKCSVIPYPFGLGRVDREVQGVADAERRHFLDVMRERVAPRMDLTPEALTHWNALDLRTGQLLPYWENIWSRQQDRTTLTPYISLGLEILNATGMRCSGITSPWDFGDGVEPEYAEAILAAQQRVNGLSATWYFLQLDGTSRHVPPRLSVFRPEAGEVVVSIVTCDIYDFGRGVWHGGQPDPDALITADGRGGRLAEVLAAGGPAAFHTHWQTVFSQGNASGLLGLRTVIDRVVEHFGDRIAWTGCADLAAYAAAAAGARLSTGEANDSGYTLDSETAFPCRRFTISLPCARAVRSVRLDDRPLAAAGGRVTFAEGSYLHEEGQLFLCWPLAGSQRLSITWA